MLPNVFSHTAMIITLYRERDFHVLKFSLSVALINKRYSDKSHVYSYVSYICIPLTYLMSVSVMIIT